MYALKEHIAFKVLMIALVFTLLVPSFVKIAHMFSHHKHEICKNEKTTHIHQVELDCDFQKFQLNNNFIITTPLVIEPEVEKIEQQYNSKYKFLYSYKTVIFLLRGPPTLV